MMNDKTYNIVKWVVLTVLPALGVFIGALGKIYCWEFTDTTVLTLNAVAVFLGGITGVSALNYNKENK